MIKVEVIYVLDSGEEKTQYFNITNHHLSDAYQSGMTFDMFVRDMVINAYDGDEEWDSYSLTFLSE